MKKRIMLIVASTICSFGLTLLLLALTLLYAQSLVARTTEVNDDCSNGRCVVYYALHCIEQDCQTSRTHCTCGTVANCICKPL
jgi:hypothetical protein